VTPKDYDAWYDTPRGRWIGDTEYRLVRRSLGLQPGDSVLDVGCGTGWFTRRAAEDAARVIGLDRDADALAFAHGRGAGPEDYVPGDATALPFADASFDAVLSVTALCFVEQWPQALAEIVRVSRRRFVVGLLNRHSLLWLDKGRQGGSGAYRGAHWHTRAEIDDELRALLVRNAQFRYGVFLP
jgi:ubiquinone/menaquinone biosynthesis C-methylase UbiE